MLELLLALTLLVIIGAMIWPALEKPFAAERLRRAGDQIRAHWGRARNRAINSGETYSFRAQLGADRYLIERYAGLDVGTTQASSTASSNGTSAGVPVLRVDARLPRDITISDVQVGHDARSQHEQLEYAGEQAATGRDEAWSTHALFFPDGSTSSVVLTLANQYGATVTVTLRGLTGTSVISDVAAADPRETRALERE